MKLIYCPECRDIVRLTMAKRRCMCAMSWGWYKSDGWHAVVCGEAVPIGIDNNIFQFEVAKYMRNTETGVFKAWIFDRGYEGIERSES